MKGLLKFIGGLALGAAVGAGAYLVLTNEDEEGVIHDLKMLVNEVLEAGKEAAQTRRAELERELGHQSEGVSV